MKFVATFINPVTHWTHGILRMKDGAMVSRSSFCLLES